jgi:hypothetical protein
MDWGSVFDCQGRSRRVRQRISGSQWFHNNILLNSGAQSDHTNAGQALTYDFLLAYERRLNERLKLVAPCLLQRDHILERDDRVAVRASEKADVLLAWAYASFCSGNVSC